MTTRPQQRKSGGARQKIWNALRRRSQPVTIAELAELSGSTRSQIRAFLSVLHNHGYLDWRSEYQRAPVEVTLVIDTGPQCPSVSTEKNTMHDWNLNPAMPANDLKKLFQSLREEAEKNYGENYSMNRFGVDLGLGENNGSRIRDMMNGRRPISPAIERGAKALMKKTGSL